LRSKDKHDALFIYKISQAEKKLDLGHHFDCLDMLKETQTEMSNFPDTDAVVFSRFFFTFSLYYRRRDDQENYYQQSL
jgi:hypothetical protein